MTTSTAAQVPYRTHATADGKLLADSSASVRVDTLDGAPVLWFPRCDVDESVLETLDPEHWRAGTGDLADHVAFDDQDVVLTVIDGRPGDDERDVTTKRFPNWGDASDLIAVLDVQADGDGRYVGATRGDWRRPVVEGSQILAQAIVAAARHAPGRRVASASMVFTRPADSRTPYSIDLEEVTGGRTFTALAVRATQGDRTCAFGSLLVGTTAPDVMRHAEPAPEGPGPYDSIPYDMSLTGRDLRIVDGAYTGDPDAPVGPPEIDAWVRFRDVPDDQAIHAALLTQFTGNMSIAAALRPHAGVGQDAAHRTLSTAVNAITLTIHADVRADRWMRYHHRSTFAGDGMTHSECRVYVEDESLVASFTVESMVRRFAGPSRPVDSRTAL